MNYGLAILAGEREHSEKILARISHRSAGLKFGASSLTLLISLGIVGALALVVPATATSPKISFSNYELSRSGNSTFSGVTCPNGGTDCWNWNGEPNIATAPDGTVYASSENTAFNHPSECQDPSGGIISQTLYICGGTGAWKSTDGGSHFTSLTSPNTNYDTGTAATLWGGDTQVATATAKNTNGFYNVYVVSLEAAVTGLVGDGESTSLDGGATWANNPFAVQFTNAVSAPGVQDRPWIAAYGANEVCISSHAGAVVPMVYCSLDAGLTFPQQTPAFDAAHSFLTAETSIPGALKIDPNSGTIYLPFSGLANAAEAANPVEVACGSTTGITCPFGLHAIYMAVSTDGGLTFTDYPVYTNPSQSTNYGSQFLQAAVDQAGNVYEAYSDGVNLFYSISTNHGQTWNGPYQVNQSPSSWAVEPWITAGSAGRVDIVWYGTGNCGSGITVVDSCLQSATWSVYMAQNLNAISNPSGFTQTQVTGTIHEGPVCTNGSGCQSYRGLFDDFGVTVSPATGLANIVYDNDMYTPSDPANLPNPDCTSQYASPVDPAQQNCVHTDIAHQTSGTGLFPKHTFNIKQVSLSSVGLTNAGYGAVIMNTGDLPITGLSVTLDGVPISASWNTTLPLQPGNTISGASEVPLQSLSLVLGATYPTVITATFSDGAVVSETTSVQFVS